MTFKVNLSNSSDTSFEPGDKSFNLGFGFLICKTVFFQRIIMGKNGDSARGVFKLSRSSKCLILVSCLILIIFLWISKNPTIV